MPYSNSHSLYNKYNILNNIFVIDSLSCNKSMQENHLYLNIVNNMNGYMQYNVLISLITHWYRIDPNNIHIQAFQMML